MDRQIVFRVDASVEMGLGHLIRCLTLADALAVNGTRSWFLMRSHASGLSHLAVSRGHAVRLLSDPPAQPRPIDGGPYAHWLPTDWQQDADQTRQALEAIGDVGWLIVDHYALDAKWERACRRDGMRILAIDDLADREHECAVLLDQNLVEKMETRYRGLLPAACRQLLGPRYALLRPEFAEQRRCLSRRSGKIKRILICFGGADPTNETLKALEAIKNPAMSQLTVDVVIGQSNPHAAAVEALCRSMINVALHRGANNVADLMRCADLAIGAGGVMSWERCCLGLPAVTIGIADNQAEVLTALESVGAIMNIGPASSVTTEGIAQAMHSLLGNPEQVRLMSEISRSLVDGLGAERARSLILC